VTGAGGFIGGHVAEAFETAGRRVVRLGHSLDALTRPTSAALAGPIKAEVLLRASALFGPPAIVVHTAGGSSVAASVSDPAADFDRTVGSLNAVLDFIDQHAPSVRLVFLSSAAVYGSSDAAVISEGAPLNPISPYGQHKKLAEDMIKERAAIRNLDATILRLFSVYGPGNRKQLFWDVANRLSKRPKRLELAGSGQEARDFLYIDDAVRLVRILADLTRGDAPLVVNGGSGVGQTVREVAQALCRSLQLDVEVAFTGAPRAGDPARMISDVSLAKKVGFSPDVSFEAGVQRLADWVRGEIFES
jgi:UDP-glucose 4-epimerase